LAIAALTGADADHRHAEFSAEPRGQLGRHMLEHQGKATGLLQLQGPLPQALLRHRVGGLAPVAQLMHRLRREPQMPHHGDAAAHQAVDHGDGFGFAALQFHAGATGFLEEAAGGSHGLIRAALIAQKGQIADDRGVP